MNHVITTPSLRLKAFAAVAKWALWLLATAWVTLGLVWVGLHFVIVPRISEFRPWLEQQASSALGITVRIGAIAAKSNGLIPSIELTDVRLQDTQGRDALRLPSVLAALSPRSAMGLGFEQLYVEAPELDVRRTPDGRIWVAGFVLPDTQSAGASAVDWLFSQTELAVRHGRIRWTDELRAMPALQLEDVDVVVRNRLRKHLVRFDANPPAGWGQRISVMGDFQQPLLTRKNGQWRDWTGQLYTQSAEVDLAQLRNYANLGFDLTRGAGGLRAWVGIDRARITGATADVVLNQVTARVSPRLEPLDFAWVTGRLGYRVLNGGEEYTSQNLQFETQDGLHWPGGNVRLALFNSEPALVPRGPIRPAHGEFSADRLDLPALAEISDRLPLDDAWRARLQSMAPRGMVESLNAVWQGAIEAPQTYSARGQVSGLQISANSQGGRSNPGVRGLDLAFDLNETGGKASLSMKDGALDLPDLLVEPALSFAALSGQVQWKHDDQRISVDVARLIFANADGQGELQAHWHSSSAATGAGDHHAARGVLDLQGSLSRMEGAALYRYLPMAMDKEGRDYLRAAVLGGTASNVKFRVAGDLAKFPFYDAAQGEFRISANVQNAVFAFAPPLIMPRDSLPWPAVTHASCELLIDHDTLQVKNGKAAVAGHPGLQVTKGEALVSRLYDALLVSVNLDARGPLTESLAVVNNSPVGAWTGKVMSRATATGNADYHLKLTVPVLDVDKSTVQGTVQLAGNDLQISPDLPRLARARGQLAFNESGFVVNAGQARILGGDVRIEGGLSLTGNGLTTRTSSTVLRLQGVATADGLRQSRELGAIARLGQHASGAAPYSAVIGLRSGVPELVVTSSLVGMGLTLPAPFAKAAEASLPLRFETAVVRSSMAAGARLQDQIQIDVGRMANAVYVRDIAGPESRVLRGSIAVGLAMDESAPLPADGVVANMNVDKLDVDAWTKVLSGASSATAAINTAAMGYLPNTVALRAKELVVEGRTINNVVVGGGRDGLLWRANVNANELNGYLEYRQPSGNGQGRVFARLAHLNLGPSAAQDMESLLDQQPASIPALDIIVEDLVLRGKKLGRVELQATNMGRGSGRDAGREWRLNRFNVTLPEATFTASGNWAVVNAQAGSGASGSGEAAAAAPAKNARDRRRTVLNFKLDIADSGELLARFGMPGVIAKGKGKLEGQVAWLGSPLNLDYPSLGGAINVNVESGQFLKADPGIAKLFGVLSLQSLPRRLTLDFRDVFSDGFSFDFVRGDVAIDQGIARTSNLQMKGVNAAVLLDGQADIEKETQHINVVVIPEINAGSASLLASAVNPLVGLTTFLAQAILRGPLINANTQVFLIDGTWIDPHVTKVERK